MEDDDEEEEICKIVLLGESGVGKTCIISRFINYFFILILINIIYNFKNLNQ